MVPPGYAKATRNQVDHTRSGNRSDSKDLDHAAGIDASARGMEYYTVAAESRGFNTWYEAQGPFKPEPY